MGKILHVLIFLLVCVVSTHACDETVKIDSVEYNIDDIWCGQKIDTTEIPVYEDLSRLPEELCFKDYKIYIRKEAKKAFVKMAEAAAADSVFFTVKSGFRSIAYQKRVIKKRMAEGKSFEQIIRVVAPPGYSEHLTGNAVDIVTDTQPFSKSKAYRWLLENAKKYEFIERYPKGNKTLQTWEPWHWTFVGSETNSTKK